MKKYKNVGELWNSDEVLTSGKSASFSRSDAIRSAFSADLQPLGEALAGALQAGDAAAFQAALKKISERMPEFLESQEMADLLADEFVSALTQPDPEP